MSATAKAIFDGDSARLDAVIKGIDRKLLALQAQFAAVASFTAAVFALPAAAAVGLAVGIGKVLEVGGALNDLHNNTGIAIEDLVVLQEEFKEAGKQGEDVGKVINKMQDTLAKGTANSLIADLGIDMEELRRQTPIAQFHKLGGEIDRIGDASDRLAAARAIFGKEGGSLLSLFASKGFGQAAIAVGEQAQILARDAALFDDVGDKLGTAGLKVQGFFVGVADRVVPVLSPLLDKLIAIDLAQKGRDTGDMIAVFAQALADENLGEILNATLDYSMASVVNFFVSGMLTGVGYIGAAFISLMDKIHTLLIGTFLDAVSVLDRIPGVKGYVEERRANLYANQDADSRDMKRLMGLGKFGQLFDTDALRRQMETVIGRSAQSAESARNAALAQFKDRPTGPLEDGLFGGSGGAGVSALARIGGAFGGSGGSDPLLDATRESNSLLKEIRDRLTPAGDSSPSRASLIARYH